MAGKISQLTAANQIDGTELIEIVQAGENRSVMVALLGVVGPQGISGLDGQSAYALAVEHGFVGSEVNWIASLHGGRGDMGDTGPQGIQGNPGSTGKSAYELAVDNGFVGTLEDWLISLRGEPGPAGQNGQDGNSLPLIYNFNNDSLYIEYPDTSVKMIGGLSIVARLTALEEAFAAL